MGRTGLVCLKDAGVDMHTLAVKPLGRCSASS